MLVPILLKEEMDMKIGTYFDDYEFSCKCERHAVDGQGHNVLDHIIDKRQQTSPMMESMLMR